MFCRAYCHRDTGCFGCVGSANFQPRAKPRQGMLQIIGNDVRKHNYDPKFHGLDWDAKVAQAKQKISQATSFNMAISQVARLKRANIY